MNSIDLETTSNSESRVSRRWTLESPLSEIVIAYRSGPDLKLILNRPRTGNRLTQEVIIALASRFERLKRDKEIRRVVIMSAGLFFCTGVDARTQADCETNNRSSENLLRNIATANQTTIASISGKVAGAGVGLAFACDVRMAHTESTFQLPRNMDTDTAAIVSRYLIREWGLPMARGAFISAAPVSAQRLYGIGAINEAAAGETCLTDRLSKHLDTLAARSLMSSHWKALARM